MLERLIDFSKPAPSEFTFRECHKVVVKNSSSSDANRGAQPGPMPAAAAAENRGRHSSRRTNTESFTAGNSGQGATASLTVLGVPAMWFL